MLTMLLVSSLFAATPTPPTMLGPGSHRLQGSSEYALELKQEYLVPALDLIKRSLPLGPLKGFRQVNLTFQKKKFVVNIPFMLTECTTVASRTADIFKCSDEKNQARLEITGLPLRSNWVKEFATQIKDPHPMLRELNQEKSKQTMGSYAVAPAATSRGRIEELLCKKLAAAYNVTPTLATAFNCRLTLADDLMPRAGSHRILLQKENEPYLYEISVWFQDKGMAGYYTLIPLIALHSLKEAP